jgi:hypothetical protein
MPLKPLAVMIKKTYRNLVIYALLAYNFEIAALVFGFFYNTWFFLFFIPVIFFLWLIWNIENEIKDLLVSI